MATLGPLRIVMFLMMRIQTKNLSNKEQMLTQLIALEACTHGINYWLFTGSPPLLL